MNFPDQEYDYEAQTLKCHIADEPAGVRRGFVAKVLGQVCALLVLVAAICAAGMSASDRARSYLLGEGA